MPRNGSGTYSLPEAPFVSQTPISSSVMNNDLADVASAITGSLARDGQGGMTAVLPMANAGATYISDPDTGLHRTGANEQALFCGGTDRIKATTTGGEINGDLNVTGVLLVGGAALLPVGLGPLPWSGTTAPTKWVLCYGQALLRASYPDLWAFAQIEIANGNTLYNNGNGSTTFGVADMRGRVAAGKDDMGGVAAGRLTDAVSGFGDGLGESGGAQTKTLVTANLPAYTPTGTIGGTASSNETNMQRNNAGNNSYTGGSSGPSPQSSTSSVTIPGSSFSFTGVPQGGTSTAFGIVQPSIIVNYIIYAGA